MMISNISSSSASTSAQQYLPSYNVPSSAKGTTAYEDTVQLSDETQRYLTSTKANTAPAQASISQIIREAAGGDIAALDRLTLVG
jgi:hypothetical protein